MKLVRMLFLWIIFPFFAARHIVLRVDHYVLYGERGPTSILESFVDAFIVHNFILNSEYIWGDRLTLVEVRKSGKEVVMADTELEW